MIFKTILCAAVASSSLVAYEMDSAMKEYYADWEFHPQSNLRYDVKKEEGFWNFVRPLNSLGDGDVVRAGDPPPPTKARPAWIWTDKHGLTSVGPLEDAPKECQPTVDDFIRIFTPVDKKKTHD